MPTVQDLLDAIEAVAPSRLAYSYDRIGLQVGSPGATVTKAVFALDPTLAAVAFAQQNGAQMLVCHHPVVWDPLTGVRYDTYRGSIVRALVEGGIAFASAHTNWDCARGGINDALAELIGLKDVRPCGSTSDKRTCKVVVTVPEGSEEAVVDAMSAAGAGVVGLYSRCAFLSNGLGTFLAKEGASPALGRVGEVERVQETRIEMSCPKERVPSVIAAMRAAHAYEEPAHDVYPVRSAGGQPIARVGSLPTAMSAEEFRRLLDERLGARTLLCAPEGARIKRVVVCGGAAADEWQAAKAAGADAFVSGEVPHHAMVEASESGIAIAASGHFATENPGALKLAREVAARTGVEALPFEPEPGRSGRPL